MHLCLAILLVTLMPSIWNQHKGNTREEATEKSLRQRQCKRALQGRDQSHSWGPKQLVEPPRLEDPPPPHMGCIEIQPTARPGHWEILSLP